MKYFKILSTLLLCLTFSFFACNEKTKSKRIDPTAIPNMAPTAVPNLSNLPSSNAGTPNSTAPEPAQNATGIWHYTCSNGCAGGAGAAGTCATCGSSLAHNQAYHASAAGTPTLPSSAPAASAGQNAAGIWHYTCGNGCAGGAGAAGACATCGSTLAHNQAYHQ